LQQERLRVKLSKEIKNLDLLKEDYRFRTFNGMFAKYVLAQAFHMDRLHEFDIYSYVHIEFYFGFSRIFE
jgi:hypothetical protein